MHTKFFRSKIPTQSPFYKKLNSICKNKFKNRRLLPVEFVTIISSRSLNVQKMNGPAVAKKAMADLRK